MPVGGLSSRWEETTMNLFGKAAVLPSPEAALPGRPERMPVPAKHFVNGNPLEPPFPDGFELALFGMGCFWGAERRFWETPGVFSTSVGYAAGLTPNPTYEEVCSGRTGHNEVVRVVIDPLSDATYAEDLESKRVQLAALVRTPLGDHPEIRAVWEELRDIVPPSIIEVDAESGPFRRTG